MNNLVSQKLIKSFSNEVFSRASGGFYIVSCLVLLFEQAIFKAREEFVLKLAVLIVSSVIFIGSAIVVN